MKPMIAFGPIPSRRLGRSLGINHIPPKACSYACIYCQAGRTTDISMERRTFHDPAEVAADVTTRVEQLRARGEAIDWLSFVPDGEPTLDVNLGRAIELVRPLGIPIAVITNATLLWRPDVRAELGLADWVCVKVDAVDEAPWNRVDRPHLSLRLDDVLDGMRVFAREFAGELTTDTMLVAGANDGVTHVRRVAAFVASLGPRRAYLSIPTRPPAEPGVQPPGPDVLQRAVAIMRESVPVVECLFDYEGSDFASTGDPAGDLLRVAAVHPVRLDAALELLERGGAGQALLDSLLADGSIEELAYGGRPFVARRQGAAG
jgi:wyosine [tRNA(Phe)-imidazoG37] synthetase (radical SAM superfamily)